MIQFSTDESLIGGFLIKNQGKIVDYSVKNKLTLDISLSKSVKKIFEGVNSSFAFVISSITNFFSLSILKSLSCYHLLYL